MIVDVTIRRNSDGVQVTTESGISLPSYWEEGNGACDCIRIALFYRGQGNEREASQTWRHECGTGAYSVRVTDAGGKIIYDELVEYAPELK